MNQIKLEATHLLNDFYQIDTLEIPTKRPVLEWEPENKRGFFLGIIQAGMDQHIIELHRLLNNKEEFQKQQEFSSRANPNHPSTFIDTLFDFYIAPFHKDY